MPAPGRPPAKTNRPPIKTTKTGQVVSPVPPNRISKAIAGSKPKRLPLGPGMSVKEQQKRLKNAGFNVTIDGIEGPQTAMARKALANGVAPGYWNKVWLKNHPPGGTSTGGAGAPSGGTPPSSSPPTPTSTSPAGRSTQGAPSAPAAPVNPYSDPAQYAANAANAEFNPQLTDANYNLSFAQKAMPESLKDLSGWNQQITNTFNQNDAAEGYQPGIDQAMAAQGNVANLFGESTSPDSQAANAGNIAMLQGLQGNQKGFQDIMQSVFAAQGRDYARRATREGNVNITKAQADRDALRAQKGAAQSKYRYDATQQSIQNQQNQAALDQAAALAPGQQALQAAQVKVAQTEASNAPAVAKLNLQKAQAETQAAISAATAAAEAAGGKLNWNDPKVVDSVSNGAVSGSIGPKGGLVLRPDLALQNILVTAQGSGAPASVVQAAISKLIRAVNISHGKKQWTRWKWNGKSFVLKPAPKKK